MAANPKTGKPWTKASDMASDRKAGIKPGSKRDNKLDTKRGVGKGQGAAKKAVGKGLGEVPGASGTPWDPTQASGRPNPGQRQGQRIQRRTNNAWTDAQSALGGARAQAQMPAWAMPPAQQQSPAGGGVSGAYQRNAWNGPGALQPGGGVMQAYQNNQQPPSLRAPSGGFGSTAPGGAPPAAGSPPAAGGAPDFEAMMAQQRSMEQGARGSLTNLQSQARPQLPGVGGGDRRGRVGKGQGAPMPPMPPMPPQVGPRPPQGPQGPVPPQAGPPKPLPLPPGVKMPPMPQRKPMTPPTLGALGPRGPQMRPMRAAGPPPPGAVPGAGGGQGKPKKKSPAKGKY